MRILFDLHTHTTYSRAPFGRTHGKGTVAQNAAAAQELGIGLGIADHGPGHAFYSIRPKDYPALRTDIAKERKGAVLCGVEANILDAEGRTDIDLVPGKLDFYLMGYHKGVLPKNRSSFRLLWPCRFNKEKAMPLLTEAICKALARYPIDLLTHPGEYVPIDMAKVAAAAVANGVALEINNRHPLREEDARIAMDCGAYFMLSSDAHRPERVGTVANAAAFATRMKIPAERIVNSDAYAFDGGLRLDRLKSFAQQFSGFSTLSTGAEKVD